jgi:hypothetical protein
MKVFIFILSYLHPLTAFSIHWYMLTTDLSLELLTLWKCMNIFCWQILTMIIYCHPLSPFCPVLSWTFYFPTKDDCYSIHCQKLLIGHLQSAVDRSVFYNYPSHRIQQSMKYVPTLLQVLVTFLVLTLPEKLCLIFNTDESIHFYFVIFASINCVFNPLIYAYNRSEFRTALRTRNVTSTCSNVGTYFMLCWIRWLG